MSSGNRPKVQQVQKWLYLKGIKVEWEKWEVVARRSESQLGLTERGAASVASTIPEKRSSTFLEIKFVVNTPQAIFILVEIANIKILINAYSENRPS